MMKRALLSSGLMAIIAGLGGSLLAADDTPAVQPAHPEHKSSINVAEQATDPSAILTQMGFFYWTTIPESREGDGETFLFQPVLPLSKSNVLRPGLALVASPEPNRVTGMGDLFVLDAFFFHTPNATFGVGPVASFPTATKDELGTGQYSVGADFLFIYKGIKKNISGILLYTQTSVAGDDDRPDVNQLIYNFIWVRHFNGWYLGWTDQLGVVDLENDNRVTFPTGFRFGKVFKAKRPWNMTVQPYYTYQEDRDNEYGIKFSATLILPTALRH